MFGRRLDVDGIPDSAVKRSFVIFADHLQGGGTETMTLRLAGNLVRMGHRVSLFLLSRHGQRLPVPAGVRLVDLTDEADWGAMGIYTRSMPGPLMARINQLIAAESPDLVLLSWCVPQTFSAFITHRNVWHWVHGRLHVLNTLGTLCHLLGFLRWGFSTFRSFRHTFGGRRLVFVDAGLARRWPFAALNLKYVQIANGVSLEGSDHGEDKRYDLAFVARLSSEKQPSHAIAAFARSALKGRMVVVGDGPLLPELIRYADNLGLTGRIDFVGWSNEPERYIAQSRALVLTSEHEGFGLVLIEALKLAVPVIAYNSGAGVARIFKRLGARQYLIPRNDIGRLARGMSELVDAPYQVSDRFLQEYGLDRMSERFVRLASL